MSDSLISKREKPNRSLRVFLNLLTGWNCIGFCQEGADEESQKACDEICGAGRASQSKQLNK